MLFNKLIIDKSGIFVSTLCILHCTFLPIIFGFLPALGMEHWVHNRFIHLLFFILMVLFAVVAFILRFHRHKSMLPLIWFLSGVTLVGIGHFILKDPRTHQQPLHHVMNHTHLGPNSQMVNATNQSLIELLTNGSWSTILAVIGSILLIRGHFLNMRSCCH
ncbi:MAG: MerC domain-containing protein [Bdellovibrionales bacterium]|nr:MerC domain-containing protein [Bdellovibrionales bacterium]